MWEELSFPDTLVKNSVGRKNQIKASEVLPFGRYPVIDQGKDFIAGYCNDETKLVTEDLPYIIFGDHTRCFKFVDFPFILGADGTKVLKPNPALFDLKFHYFALLSLDIPNRGYNRHFKLLKEKEVPRPELDEQRRIARVLSAVQTAIEQQSRLIALTQELKRALMHKLFTEGLRGEKHKMAEIGPVPESWGIKMFDQFTTLQRGKDLTRRNFKNGDVPVAGSNGIIGYHDTAFVKAPGVTVGRSGSVGKVNYYAQDFWAHNTSLYVKDFHHNNPRFAAYYLEFLNLWRFKSGASVPTLDRNSFRTMLIAVPEISEQKEIAQMLSMFDKRISVIQQKRTLLEELFRSLLHQLMTGQVRVNELGLEDITGE